MTADIVFIQEPYVGFIRNIPSSSNPLGDPLEGGTSHPEWIAIYPPISNAVRVAVYIHKRHAAAAPQTLPEFSSSHLLCVRLTFRHCTASFLNVYAHPDTHSAIYDMFDFPRLPADLRFIGGDFNLHHPAWSKPRQDLGQGRPIARALIDRMSEHGFVLGNTAGIATYTPHNNTNREAVLDLGWLPTALYLHEDYNCRVDPDQRLHSDHSPVFHTLPIRPSFKSQRRLVPHTDEENAFVEDITDAFQDLEGVELESAQDIQAACDRMYERINASFERNSKVSRHTTRSKTWWNDECTRARDLFRDDRSDENRKAYRKTYRKAQREYYDVVIKQATNDGRVWGLTSWTKARPVNTTSGLVDRNGNTLTDPDSIREGFAARFFSAQDRQVDLTLFDELEAKPTRTYEPLTVAEIREVLSKCGNTAPGADHISWRHMKRLASNDRACAQLCRFLDACIRKAYWPR